MIEFIETPAIVINNRYEIYFASKNAEISRPVLSDYQRGYCKTIKVIDSASMLYDLSEVYPVHQPSLLLLFISKYIYSPRILVDYRKADARKISYDDASSMIVRCIKKNRKFWQSGGNIDEIISNVGSQRELTGLIKYLGKLIHGHNG